MGVLHLITVFYLLITAIFGYMSANTPVGSQLSYSGNLSQFQSNIKNQSEGLAQPGTGVKGFAMIASDYINVITLMSTFSFTLTGAPAIINNYFVTPFFGILSVLFWFGVIREVVSVALSLLRAL